jgi:mannose-6-phosphate isomerase-like protein (cupin superfamily)
MKRTHLIASAGFVTGIVFTLVATGIFAISSKQGAYVSSHTMSWTGHDSHGPGTSLKFVMGRQSDVKMESLASIWMTRIGVGGYNQVHEHEAEEQAYHILQGKGRMVVGEKEYEVGAGDFGYFPRGVKHGLYNEGNSPIIFVGIGAKTGP